MIENKARETAIGLWKSLDLFLRHGSRLGLIENIFRDAVELCQTISPIAGSRISPTGLSMDLFAPSVWHATCYFLIQYFASRVTELPFSSDVNMFDTFYGNRPVFRGQTHGWNIIPSGWRGVNQDFAEFQRTVFTEVVASYMTPDDALEFDLFGRVTSNKEGVGLAQHFGIPTNLVDFTFDPRIALYFASSRSDAPPFHALEHDVTECAVVYFTSFVKLCATGSPALCFPPAQSERLYRQAGFVVDFGPCPEQIPELLDFEANWMWVQQNCGRLFFQEPIQK